MTVYAVFLFIQFSVLEIILVSLWFGFIFLTIFYIFQKNNFHLRQVINVSYKSVLSSLAISVLLFMFSYGFPTKFQNFYKIFPLIEVFLGNDWSSDSSFHVSLIQSFIKLGYPSTGLHGAPLLHYHTLSHLVDSLGLRLVRISPYDSYGLFFHFKIWLVLSFVNIFIIKLLKKGLGLSYIIFLILLTPIIMGTWHLIGSHGEWFSGVLSLASVGWIYSLIKSSERMSSRHYLYLFLLISIISLGKISMGFTLAVFVGFLLLLKNLRDTRTYILGLFWLLLFIFLKLLFTVPNSIKNLGFKSISVADIANGSISFSHYQHLASIIFLIVFLMILSAIYKVFLLRVIGLAYLLSFTVAFTICFIFSVLDPNGVWYFLHALSFYGILFTVLCVFENVHFNLKSPKTITLFLLFFTFNNPYISFRGKTLFPITQFSLSKANNIAIKGPTRFINKLVSQEKVSFFGLRSHRSEFAKIYKQSGFLSLEKRVEEIMFNNGFNLATTRLFIPKSFLLQEFNQYERKWRVLGLLFYSITGVPLIHGVYEINYGYGLRLYDDVSFMRDELGADSCEGIENVIKVKSFDNLEIIKC